MDPKAFLSFRSKSKDTTTESIRTNGKDGKIRLIVTRLTKDDQQLVLLLPARWWPDTLPKFEKSSGNVHKRE